MNGIHVLAVFERGYLISQDIRMEFFKFSWILFFMDFVTGTIRTIPSIDVILGHTPTLTCTYNRNGNPEWMFIRWNRVLESENGTKKTPLALMKNMVGAAPEWLEKAPEEFMDHVTLMETSDEGAVSFNMRIDEFKCIDEGEYECEIFTYDQPLNARTAIHAKAHPGSPRIHEDMIQAKENDTFSLHCHADVGIPPVELSWSYKPKGRNVWQLLEEGVKQENSRSRDCNFKALSSVPVFMSEELDGALFRCMTSPETGEEGDHSNRDEVLLQLHRKTTTTTPATTTACTGVTCDQQDIIDESSSANVCAQSLTTSFLVTLATGVISRTFYYRS